MANQIEIGGGLILEEGMLGLFTRRQADGAIPNGSRVVKVKSESGDATGHGEVGTVLGSLAVGNDEELRTALRPEFRDCDYFYFVEWDWKPRTAVGVGEHKIARHE